MNYTQFAKLIRLPNLIIIALTQLLIWFSVIRLLPTWSSKTVFLNLTPTLLLILSTILIAAGGYVINDYFDVKIDSVNRPEKSLIGKDINPRFAIILHSACNAIGITLAAFLAYKIGNLWLVAIQLLTTILLWVYSTHFKRQFVIGNIVVAILTALSVLIILAYESSLYAYILKPAFLNINAKIYVNPVWVLFIYTFFAFMLTWMREIVKDMEDFKGDAEDGCMTMPIKIGLFKSARFVQILGIITLVPLLFAAYKLIISEWKILGIYIAFFIVLPLLFFITNINKSTTSTHYAKSSKRLKVLMVLGIATLLLFYYLQYHF